MNTLEKLVQLLELGIPQGVIAQFAHCHKTTISKIARNEYKPSEKMLYLIEDGLNKLYDEIKKCMGD